MSNIYETKYYAERRDRGTNAIDLQLKYRDEIEKCLEDDEMYQVFKKDKKDYYQQKYPDLNGEKFDQYMRFQYYYIFRDDLPIEYVKPDEYVYDEKTNNDENSSPQTFNLNTEYNPDIVKALQSEVVWKQCHEDLRNTFQNENDINKVVDKLWTLENVLITSSQNDLQNSFIVLELSHLFIVKYMDKDQFAIVDEMKESIMEEATKEMQANYLFPDDEIMRGMGDDMQSMLQKILPHTPAIQDYEEKVNDVNRARRQALSKIHDKVVDIVDNNDDHVTDHDKQSQLMQLLLVIGSNNEDEQRSSTHLNSYSTIEYLFLILNDYIIQSNVEAKKLVCCIISKCMSNTSFVQLMEAFKEKGIVTCQGALLYLSLTKKQGFPPLDMILDYIKEHCSKMEDLPVDIQEKLSQNLENFLRLPAATRRGNRGGTLQEPYSATSRNAGSPQYPDPNVLKYILSFFKSIPPHMLVDAGVVSRCISLLAGGGGVVTSTALTNVSSSGYYGKRITILKDDLSAKVLDLLYHIALDGEYAAAAIETADENLATILQYLCDDVGNDICDKATQIVLKIMDTSKLRQSYQYKVSSYYNGYSNNFGRNFRCSDELTNLIHCATNESCTNLIFALQIKAQENGSQLDVYHDSHITALRNLLTLQKLKEMTHSMDEVTKQALGIISSDSRTYGQQQDIRGLLAFLSRWDRAETKQQKKLYNEQKALACQVLHNCMIQCPSIIGTVLRFRGDNHESLKTSQRLHTFVNSAPFTEVIALLEAPCVDSWRKIFGKSSFMLEDRWRDASIEKFQDNLSADQELKKENGLLSRLLCCCCKCQCCECRDDVDGMNTSISTVKIMQGGNYIDIKTADIEMRLRHQPNYWHTARRFNASSDKAASNYNQELEHWDIFTRENLLRVRHTTTSRDYDERVSVFKKTEECNDAAMAIYTSLQKEGGCEEYEPFGEQYRKHSKPCWTWVVGSQSDQHGLPAYTSKIGGAPAVYLDLMKIWDFYEEMELHCGYGNFMFQIDLSTIPVRLQERLGSSGLLQFFDSGSDDGAHIFHKFIPEEDFAMLVGGRESSKVPEAPIVDWTEHYDLPLNSEPREKFGGYFVDVQGHGGNALVPDDKLDFMFETRSCSNMFGLNLGDNGNLQYYGCMDENNPWSRNNFSCY